MAKAIKGASELAWVVQIPNPCGHCGKEEPQFIGWFQDKTEASCSACGSVLDLNTAEWAAFSDAFVKLCVGKYAPIAPIK